MKAVCISDWPLSSGGGPVAKKTEDWVLDVVGIVQRQTGADTCEEGVM